MIINIKMEIIDADDNIQNQEKFLSEFKENISQFIDIDFESYNQWYNIYVKNINITKDGKDIYNHVYWDEYDEID